MSEEKKRSNRSAKRKRQLRICLAFLLMFVVVFCIAAYKVSSQLLTEHKENRGFAELIAQVEANRQLERSGGVPAAVDSTEAQEPDSSEDSTDAQTPGLSAEPETAERVMLPQYASLYAQNPDLFGWIEIQDTKVNYPVMYTPEDPEVYLHKAFDGSKSASGVPFLDGGCYLDCGNYIVYGHNMKNGTMFASILSYAKEDYWREHPVIRFDTLYDTGTYEVVAALYSRVYATDEQGVFRYYNYRDLSDPEVFEEYVAQVRDAALYDTGLEVTYGDQLLTLSTCEYSAKNGRFVVVARKLDSAGS